MCIIYRLKCVKHQAPVHFEHWLEALKCAVCFTYMCYSFFSFVAMFAVGI